MVKPSDIDTQKNDYFMGSHFGKAEKEIVARNITVLSQALAFEKDDDRWHPFTQAEYEEFRSATSENPVGYKERAVIEGLVNTGYLQLDEAERYSVTSEFLGVVVQFVKPDVAEQFIVSN